MSRLILLLVACCLATAVSAYEQPVYAVIEERGGFEIRRYAGYLVAETEVEGDFNAARNAAFRRLFAYIGGSNSRDERIEMTVPVTTASAGQKIAMTVPVTTGMGGGSTSMQFMVPSQYTLENVPRPTDERVRIRAVDERVVAARRYSGRSNEENFRREEAELLGLLAAAGLKPAGPPQMAVYNGPLTPWFMRRNEVLVPLEWVSR